LARYRRASRARLWGGGKSVSEIGPRLAHGYISTQSRSRSVQELVAGLDGPYRVAGSVRSETNGVENALGGGFRDTPLAPKKILATSKRPMLGRGAPARRQKSRIIETDRRGDREIGGKAARADLPRANRYYWVRGSDVTRPRRAICVRCCLGGRRAWTCRALKGD